MKINRKWAVGIGVGLSIGAVFWMREMASWRPVTVGRVGFAPTQLKVARDGRWLLAEDGSQNQGGILDLQTGHIDPDDSHVRDFDKNHGLTTFPRVQVGVFAGQIRFLGKFAGELRFQPQPHRSIPLLSDKNSFFPSSAIYEGSFSTSWSKTRREAYGEANGEIWLWNWSSGKLKKRVRYEKSSSSQAIFSPDGKWLLAYDDFGLADAGGVLFLYNVQNGKKVFSVGQRSEIASYGFSPDGQFIWSVTSGCFGTLTGAKTFNIYRAGNARFLWSIACATPVKWLADNRIGIVADNGFEWRDASGRLLQRLRGPYQIPMAKSPLDFVQDWALSPDSNWIYSAEQSGTIRRWRAR